MKNLNHYDQIQDFISGNLSKKQQEKFKSDLNQDADLALEYKAALATDKAIALLGDQRLKQKLQESNNPFKVDTKKSSKKPWLKLAAAITFLIVASVIALLYLQAPSPQTLAKEGFTEPPLLSLRTPNKGQKQSDLAIGEFAYDQENLAAAATVLSKIEQNDKDFNLAQLTLGATYFKQQEYDLAIAIFTQLANTQNNYKQQAAWNLAMTYLAKKDISQARQLLQQIDNEGNITNKRRENLAKILRQLKE